MGSSPSPATAMEEGRTHVVRCVLLLATLCVAASQGLESGRGEGRRGLQLWSRSGIRSTPLIDLRPDGSVGVADQLTEEEAEQVRKTAVQLLGTLYQRQLLPFRTSNYARTKGVLDRVPLERFMDIAAHALVGIEHEHCLEWGPFFTRWPNVTQPYMKKFKCKNQWTFNHDAQHPRVRTMFSATVFGELDRSLSDQSLQDVASKFDLVIIPQTLQYVVDPHLSARMLFDLVKPGGFLVFSSPFVQTIMPYPTDYFRLTAEGNELVLRNAGFQIVKSFVGGDDFWSMCWIMHCGVSDLPPWALDNALKEAGREYSHNSYMLSAQLARKPGGQAAGDAAPQAT